MDVKLTRWCFVPSCRNTAVNSPNKIFVSVPVDYERKKEWFKAARRDMPKSKSRFFCCEDHFNLEEDMENYMRFKFMGGNIIMKAGVVPHKYIDRQLDLERRLTYAKERQHQEQIATLTEKYNSDEEPVDTLDVSSASTSVGT